MGLWEEGWGGELPEDPLSEHAPGSAGAAVSPPPGLRAIGSPVFAPSQNHRLPSPTADTFLLSFLLPVVK